LPFEQEECSTADTSSAGDPSSAVNIGLSEDISIARDPSSIGNICSSEDISIARDPSPVGNTCSSEDISIAQDSSSSEDINIAGDPSSAVNISSTENTNRSKARVDRILKISQLDQSTVSLLKENIRNWIKEPSTFWRQDQNNPSISVVEDPQHLVILNVLNNENENALSGLRRRFYCLVLLRLWKDMPTDEEKWTIAEKLHQYRPAIPIKSPIEIIHNAYNAGVQYRRITNSIGIGGLFHLGTDLGRTV
jgi:hypothetical protein